MLAAVALGGCARRRARTPNLLVIAVGALRLDEVGCYGGKAGATPELDAFAARSTRFENAYAAAPWNVPSVASLWTGELPSRHGLQRLDRSLDGKVQTLAEVLREQGYRTHAAVSDFRLGRSRALDQGFETFTSVDVHDPGGKLAQRVVDSVATQFAFAARSDQPFFVFAHFGDLAPSLERLQNEVTDVRRVHPPVDDGLELSGPLGGTLSPQELADEREGYLADLRSIDAAIGQLLAQLEAQGLTRDTLVVVTATHGYEWGSRSWGIEPPSLSEALVRVPVLIAGGARVRSGRTVVEPVSQVALARTLLELLGLPSSGLTGRAASLAPLLRGDPQPELAPVAFEIDYEPSFNGVRSAAARQRGLRSGSWKLVRDLDSGGTRLCDLSADPQERDDLARRRPSELASLSKALEERFKAPR